MIHLGVLMRQRAGELQEADKSANKAAMQPKVHKRKQVHQEGTLMVKDGIQLTTLKEFGRAVMGRRARRECALRWANCLKNAVDVAARQSITHAYKGMKQR
jgi:hypothetical protein